MKEEGTTNQVIIETLAPKAMVGPSHPSFGTLVGKVLLFGEPPPEKEFPLDPACGKMYEGKPTPTTRFFTVAEDGGLADVLVYVKEGPILNKDSLPEDVPLLEQVNCEFVPYIVGVRAGQPLMVRNSDPFLHNVHAVPTGQGNKEINLAQLPGSKDIKLTFSQSEIFLKVKCDVHQWMFAWVAVMDHPFFAISDKNGTLQIGDLPPGEYTFEAVHRRAGKQQFKVAIKPGEQSPWLVEFHLSRANP